MDSTERNQVSLLRGHGIMATVVIAVILILGYPLSLGPAVWVYGHTTNPTAKKAIEAFYSPLEMATTDTPLYPILQEYAELFE